MNPETLKIHDRCDAGMFLSQLRSITTVQPLNLPAPEEYNVVKRLMDTFNTVFDQTVRTIPFVCFSAVILTSLISCSRNSPL
jgi:hypothetical protein